MRTVTTSQLRTLGAEVVGEESLLLTRYGKVVALVLPVDSFGSEHGFDLKDWEKVEQKWPHLSPAEIVRVLVQKEIWKSSGDSKPDGRREWEQNLAQKLAEVERQIARIIELIGGEQ